ncbi:MAG TPA: phage holin family protein, partial [Verrucomicrobiae bacterium]|nr:phage holin family protein [Verrucomicrobiae bacterium]
TAELRTLVQKELELFRVEVSEKMSRVMTDVAKLAVGGVMAYTGVLAVVASVILLLAMFIPAWVAALAVGVATGGTGFFLIRKGREDIRKASLVPDQTAETLKETAEWAKAQMK